MRRLVLFTFFSALGAAIHFLSFQFTGPIAYKLAPPEPPPRVVSDEEAIKKLQSGRYGFVYASPSEQDVENKKSNIQSEESYDFYVLHVEPIRNKIELIINVVFIALYLIVSYLFFVHIYRWIKNSDIGSSLRFLGRFATRIIALIGRPFSGVMGLVQARSVEAEFSSIKNLYENGLINENDFNEKKRKLQARIKKNI
ncbi:hypothetical protein GTP23_17535 [Pseudoduganella sp. FT93W]|uniref:SHOCT domain-containing protein n=1 Tax=Duganella fentianensis TaxID=2692177 RepID=A0A845I3K5_9BURK|nr:hypothetical protein [Duganella fentianensis]MYN46847.1 hypothetical protein [Duganella fentianensis]